MIGPVDALYHFVTAFPRDLLHAIPITSFPRRREFRTYFIYRHLCDGGDVGCSFRRIARSNMSILQGLPTTRCAPTRSLRDRVLSLPQWTRNGRRPLHSAPSLRVADEIGSSLSLHHETPARGNVADPRGSLTRASGAG